MTTYVADDIDVVAGVVAADNIACLHLFFFVVIMFVGFIYKIDWPKTSVS